MSKQLQAVCVLLLAGIFIIQLIGLLSTKRPVALRSNAMMRNIDGERDLSGNYNGFYNSGYETDLRVLDENGNCFSGAC